jgi:hypothetical protein
MENRSSGTRIRPAWDSLSGQCHAHRRGIPIGSQPDNEERGQSFRTAVGPVDAESNGHGPANKQLEQIGNFCVEDSNAGETQTWRDMHGSPLRRRSNIRHSIRSVHANGI